MKYLTWVNGAGAVGRPGLAGRMAAKPALSFAYDNLYFEPTDGNLFYVLDGAMPHLSDEQAAEVTAFIDGVTEDDLVVHGVDARGVYMGQVRRALAAAEVIAPPPNETQHWRYDFASSQYMLVHGVDAAGAYLGNVPIEQAHQDVGSAPPRLDILMLWNFSTAAWVDQRPQAARDAEAIEAAKVVFLQAVQAHLDVEAARHGYDNIVSACSYAGAPNPFQAEGQSFVAWRGAVWAYCYQRLANVTQGNEPVPSLDALIAALPVRT